MSYDIIYDRQFIKAEKDGKEVFFPIIYAGSSNCYEVKGKGCGRRSRSWENYSFALKGKFYGVLDEMIAEAVSFRENLIERNKENLKEYTNWDVYSDERFGYFTGLYFNGNRKTSFGQYKGMFITGCKKALTVEDLREFDVCVNVHTSSYSAKELEVAGKKEIYFYPKTSQELIEKIDEFTEYLKDVPNVSMYISINADERTMKRIRETKFPTKKSRPEYKEVDEFFVVHIANYGYFHSSKRYGFRYTPYQSSGKRFISEKAASKFVKRFSERHSQYIPNIEKVEEKTTIKV